MILKINWEMDTNFSFSGNNQCWCIIIDQIFSTANKYYSSASHHEQKNKKATGQIKFLAVTTK